MSSRDLDALDRAVVNAYQGGLPVTVGTRRRQGLESPDPTRRRSVGRQASAGREAAP